MYGCTGGFTEEGMKVKDGPVMTTPGRANAGGSGGSTATTTKRNKETKAAFTAQTKSCVAT
jgi:hypothetical protein